MGHHTQFNGAVIASTAEAANNSLSTGTLGWRDIENKADYKSSTVGIADGIAPGLGCVSLSSNPAPNSQGTTKQVNVANDFTKSPQVIWGRSTDDIVKDFQAVGYQVNVRQSTRGSGQAVIIEVKGHPEIS